MLNAIYQCQICKNVLFNAFFFRYKLCYRSGVHMSEFLYLMSSIDERVKPLVFTIRKWASSVGLTNTSPGRWISNFSLTLLVLAFLQKPPSSTPILPSFNNLVKQAGNI